MASENFCSSCLELICICECSDSSEELTVLRDLAEAAEEFIESTDWRIPDYLTSKVTAWRALTEAKDGD